MNTRLDFLKLLLVLISVFSAASQHASATVITQLYDPAQLTLGNDFDSGRLLIVSNENVVFSEPYYVNSKLDGFNSVRCSLNISCGRGAFVDRPLPLVGELTAENYAIGLWFGNDGYDLIFDAILEVFSGSQSLGLVTVEANTNLLIDQFIGLGSDTPFDRFELTYQRPQANLLGIFVDDLYLSRTPIPTPTSLLLVLAGVIALRSFSRKSF